MSLKRQKVPARYLQPFDNVTRKNWGGGESEAPPLPRIGLTADMCIVYLCVWISLPGFVMLEPQSVMLVWKHEVVLRFVQFSDVEINDGNIIMIGQWCGCMLFEFLTSISVCFSGFFPVVINFLRRIPVIGSILNLPVIGPVSETSDKPLFWCGALSFGVAIIFVTMNLERQYMTRLTSLCFHSL